MISLLLCDSALEFRLVEKWQQRIDAVAGGGMATIADAEMVRRLIDPTLHSSMGLLRIVLATDLVGYAGCAAALSDARAADLAGQVHCPTTMVVGEDDASTPPSAAAAMRDSVIGSGIVTIAHAAHAPTFKRGDGVTAALLAHIRGLAHSS